MDVFINHEFKRKTKKIFTAFVIGILAGSNLLVAFKPALAAATVLAFTTQPGANETTGIVLSQQPVVAMQDGMGMTDSTATGDVALAAFTDAACSIPANAGTLNGTLTVTSSSGIAAFTNLAFSAAGTYYLQATSGALTPVCSLGITVTDGGGFVPGAATQLAFVNQPSANAQANSSFLNPASVAIEDVNGTPVTTLTDNVTIAAFSDQTCTTPAAGTLGGTLTVAAVSGIATFAGVSFDTAGIIYLGASDGALTPACSNAINVYIPALTTIDVAPANPTIAVPATQQFSASTLDQFNNPIGAVITWSSSDPSVGTIDQASGLFTAINNGQTVVTATSGGITGTTNVTVTGSPASLTITANPLTTTDPSPALTGTITDPQASIVVNLFDGSTGIGFDGVAQNNGDGTWTMSAGTINPSLPVGLYTITVNANDLQGNNASNIVNNGLVILPATPDTTAPTVPDGMIYQVISGTEVNLSWTASTDDNYVVRYHIFRGGTEVGSSSYPTYLDTALTQGQTYTYTITAEDIAGNLSAASAPLTVTINPNPPTGINVTVNPLNTTNTSPEITGTVDNPNAVINVVITPLGDSVYSGPAVNNGNGTWTLPAGMITPALTPGLGYDIQVTASDNLGNSGNDATILELWIVNPSSAIPTVTVDNLTTPDAPTITGAVNDLLSTITVNINGQIIPAVLTPSAWNYATWSATFPASFAPGTYDVVARATNAIGVGVDATTNEFVSTATPAVASIVISPQNPSVEPNGTVQFTAQAFDAGNHPLQANIAWSNSNPTIGSIDPIAGTYTAAALGSDVVTAGYNGITATTNVNVVTVVPAVTNVTVNKNIIHVADVGSTLTFSATFDQAMDQSAQPIITFDAQTSLLLQSCNGYWPDNYNYIYNCNVNNVPVIGSGNFTIANAIDLAGSSQAPYTANAILDIDTARPSVTTITPSQPKIIASDFGSAFGLAINYSEIMDQAIQPTITFDADTANVLGTCSGSWTTNQIYQYNCTVNNVPVVVASAINVDGASDAQGNTQSPFAGPAGFTIDTVNPTVTNVNVNKNYILVSDIGSLFVSTVVYSEPMDQTIQPTVTFDADAVPLMPICTGQWLDDHTYQYSCNIENVPILCNCIISVDGAKDLDGNPQAPYTSAVGIFNIDTVTPTLSAVSMASNNANSGYAKAGDTITLNFTASETLLSDPVVTIDGQSATVVNNGNNNYQAFVMLDTGNEGILPFTIDFTDAEGNAGIQVTATTDNSQVIFDRTTPVVNAGSDIRTNVPAVTLASADGAIAGVASYSWTATGPGNVTFGTPDQLNTALSADNEGVYLVRLTVTDNAGNAAFSEFNFDWEGTGPIITAIPDQSVDTGHALNFSVLASDPGNDDNLVYALGANAPVDATIDPATGAFSWTPMTAGNYTFEVTVSDGLNLATASVNVVVTDDSAPIISSIPDQLAASNVNLTFTVSATDPDGDSVIYGLGANAPIGATIDPVTGVFNWIPTTSNTYQFDLVASDHINTSAVTVNVRVNDAPIVAAIPDQTGMATHNLTFIVQASDPENDPLTYSLEPDAPAGATIDPTTGVFNWTAPLATTASFHIDVADPYHTVAALVNVNIVADSVPVIAPIADQNIYTGHQLSFIVTANDPEGDILTYGLGVNAPADATVDPVTGAFSWTPMIAGTYTFDITVSDGPNTVTSPVNVIVTDDPAPVVSPIADTLVGLNQNAAFTVQATDPDGDTLVYSMGANAPAGVAIDPAAGSFNWIPGAYGIYLFDINVNDGVNTVTVPAKVIVNDAPGWNAIADQNGLEGHALSFIALAIDPDGDQLTYSLEPDAPVDATIDPATGAFNWTPSAAGNVSFHIDANDGYYTVATLVNANIAANSAPVITPIADQNVYTGNPVNFTVLATDPDGDTLTYGLGANAPVGAVIDPITGIFNWTPGTADIYTFDVTASDGLATVSSPVNVIVTDAPVLTTINISPAAPAAVVGDSFQFTASGLDQYGNPIPVSPTWSSSDQMVGMIDATTGMFMALGAGPVTISATDGSASASVTFSVELPAPYLSSVVVSPANPAISVGQTQAFNATLTDQYGNPFVGTVSWISSDLAVGTINAQTGIFTALAAGTSVITADSNGITGTATITVNPNTPPVITPIADQEGAVDQNLVFAVQATDSENDTLSYSLSGVVPDGATIDSNTGEFSWTPDTAGEYQFEVEVSDGVNFVSATVHIEIISPINYPPTIIAIPAQNVNLGSMVMFTVYSTDPEGAALTYGLGQNAPQGAQINATTGVFDWTPESAGTYVFDITVFDGVNTVNAPVSVTVNEIVVNNPPVATAIPDQIVTAGGMVMFTVAATDPEGQPLTYGLDLNAPTGAAINPTTGAFDWTAASAGTYNFNVTVSDGVNTVNAPVNITVSAVAPTNYPPVITAIANQNVLVGNALIFNVLATDQNNDTLTYSLAAGTPTGAIIDPITGAFSWYPAIAGIYTLTVNVSDGVNNVASSINITVASAGSGVPVGGDTLGSLITSGLLTLAPGGVATSTSALNVAQPVTINALSGSATSTISLPQGTIITRVDGLNIDATTLIATSSVGNLTGLTAGTVIDGAVKWGIQNLGLNFSQPINISLYVGTDKNGQTLNILRSVSGLDSWTSDGITAPATCVVANGYCNFSATKASYYAATYATATSNSNSGNSGGGGGGGGGGIPFYLIPQVNPKTPASSNVDTTPSDDQTIVRPIPQVLGVKLYPDGSLLKSKTTKRIYIITGGKKKYVSSLNELKNYKGKKIITVDDSVLEAYPVTDKIIVQAVARQFAKGALVRNSITKRIYVIGDKNKKYISSLSELKKYKGKIIEASEEELKQYPDVKLVKK